jgi:S-adenosylmethionine hydrolase
MAIITFTSDFGPRDHYAASVKAKMLSINPSLNIVDISHEIEPCNIPHAFFVLRSCFRDFPKGTVHLVAVDAVGRKGSKFVALQLEDHYFLGNDNGLFSLISEKEPSMIAEIAVMDEQSIRFPTKEVLGKAAAHLASGSGLQDIGKYTDAIERKMNRTPRASKQQISGHVIHIDHYGNLITNIEEKVFNILHKNARYTVTFGREQHDGLHKSLNEVEGGECYVMFNSLGLLEIGINKGNACELLGLHYDSPVNIYFQRNG